MARDLRKPPKNVTEWVKGYSAARIRLLRNLAVFVFSAVAFLISLGILIWRLIT